MFPVLAAAIYGCSCRFENEISNVVNYKKELPGWIAAVLSLGLFLLRVSVDWILALGSGLGFAGLIGASGALMSTHVIHRKFPLDNPDKNHHKRYDKIK